MSKIKNYYGQHKLTKRLTLVCIFALIASIGFSQTEKGKWTIYGGSNLAFASQKISYEGEQLTKVESSSFNFGGGYFISDNLAITASLNYNKQEQDDAETSTATLLGGAKYYLNLGTNTKLYAEAGIGRMGLEIDNENESGFAYGLGAGLAIFLTDYISLDLGLSHIKADIEDIEIKNTGFAIGLSIFF